MSKMIAETYRSAPLPIEYTTRTQEIDNRMLAVSSRFEVACVSFGSLNIHTPQRFDLIRQADPNSRGFCWPNVSHLPRKV
ncbi:hypothetical protein [Candidatus Kuenenia stuttgartiensis]|uniref:hypothetical protein n=1 Tax=Kuenenia stuttgartiensis TaxID=174633 RepID=UPI00146B6B5D|nr:hypothetical protein [Candidatus Kuenenia stuttgartiensis]